MKALLTFLACLALAWAQTPAFTCPASESVPSPANCTQQCTNHFSCLTSTAAGSVSRICCEGCCVVPEIPTDVEDCTYKDSTVAVGEIVEDGCLRCFCFTSGDEVECSDQLCPVIGFEVISEFYSVTEGEDSAAELCVVLLRGTLNSTVTISFSTIEGSATQPEDYQRTAAELTFDSENSRRCVDVPIIDDGLVEADEIFFGSLGLPTTSDSGSTNLILVNPRETAVTIQSDDVAVICEYEGQSYEPGDTFPDDCNTCTCGDNGAVACTEIACPVFCEYEGQRYEPGDTFPAGDGCNTCTCSANGVPLCTLIACPLTCLYREVRYEPGENFPAGDGCNTCFCGDDGTVACTEIACPCPDGQLLVSCLVDPCTLARCPAFPLALCEADFCGGCNTRFFLEDEEVTDTCGPEINQTCPVVDSGSFGTCQHQCNTTEDCGEGRLCCFNGCGRVCLEPVEQSCSYDDREVPVGESFVARDGCSTCTCISADNLVCTLDLCPANVTCTYEGTQYTVGASFPAEDGCNTCTCSNNGLAICTLRPCPLICEYEGQRYEPGDTFPAGDGCNTCTCGDDGSADCTERECPPCPPGVPIVLCFARPCDVNRCPAYPEATCVDDYCGGCNARFFTADDTEVTEDCGDNVCPDGQPLASCLVDPCQFARCPAFPEAECEPDFCGGCNARFFLEDEEVTDTCGPEINQTCPVADSDSFGTCQHECDTTEDCGEGRLCCFNGCGRVCLEPVEQSCSYDDREVPVGESFVARDGCTTCTCISADNLMCTLDLCPANVTCTYEGTQYTVGASFPAEDGCNTCTCSINGLAICTLRPCPLICEYEGQRYEPGDTFPAGDGCNTCTCGDDGSADCTERECSPCPPGVPIVLCFARPCDVNRCPAYPEATCVDDYCGGCNARFFTADDTEVTEDCGDNVCPDDQPLVSCLVDPCQFARCPAFPEAECEPDFCGGCNARFFLEDEEVTDTCGPEINQTCPVADSDSFGTCQHECDTTEDCGEGRLCCFNGCGRVCLEPVEQSCSYDDREVPVGESIVARDGCSTCTCISADNLVCTLDFCPANVTCTYEGTQYTVGASFPAEDGCNTCTCSNNGRTICTLRPCISCATILCAPGYVCREFGSQGYCDPTCDPPFHHCGDEQRCFLVEGSCDADVGPCPHEVRCEDFDECELILCSIPFCGPNEPVTDDSQCCPYCPPPSCPGDIQMVDCFADPCQVTECPLHPDAICYSDFCGGCNARFFYPDGEEVTETCRDLCTLPADPGPCEAAIPSYFFNAETKRCEEFIYGGCQGNRNRFETVDACLRRCNNDSVCLLRPEPGDCDAFFPSYFYNATSARCEEFVYGGCGGNENRFESSLECYRTCSFDPCELILCDIPNCGDEEPIFSSDSCCPYCPEPTCPPDQSPVLCLVDPCSVEECPAFPDARCESQFCGECKARFFANGEEVTEKCEVDICALPPEPGPCDADITAYYYNPETDMCEEFSYGGCEGNRNRFETRRECLRFCVPELCSLPAVPGDCEAVFPSFFFNSETERCEEFTYGGCGGNLNRFETRRACLSHCDPDSPCLLRPESGLCLAYFPSYFYNVTSEQCEVFVYGGCGGNDNRFETASECWRTCDPEGEPPTTPTGIPCELVRCEFPTCPGGVEPVEDDEQCCPYCPEPTCPPDLPPVLCFADPCTTGGCPRFPDARCVSDYCGGCTARFYDENGEEVTEACVSEPCPDDQPAVQCLLDPCTITTCPAYPEAECVPYYCGGCNARFYIEGDEEVTEGDEEVTEGDEEVTEACEVDLPPSPTEYFTCPVLESGAVGVCVEACSGDSDCDEGYRCCSNGCGRTCQESVPTQIPYYEPLLECPSLSAQVGVCLAECQHDSDCGEDQLCCSNGCGQLCTRGQPSQPICSSLRRRILSFQEEDRPVGVYVPQCQDDGSFAPVQCHASTGYCWCVHTETGEPMSTSPAPPGTNLQCQSCSYSGLTYYTGDSFPDEDGCNECGCSENGLVFCTLRACVDPCSLPPDVGPCRGYFPAYYYNATIEKCEQFVYGGCEGNDNKFQSNGDCLRKCQPDNICLLDRDLGERCDDGREDDVSGYFYNTTSGQCEFFLYRGCEGNENRFINIEECLRTCDPDNVGPTDSTGQPCLLIACGFPICTGSDILYTDDTFCCPYCAPPEGCEPEEKRCSDGTCISLNFVCDGLRDCPEGEDEPEGCDPIIIPCEFRCGSDADDDDQSCIPESWVCDGFLDCPGGEDEMSCITPISDIPYYEPPLQCPDSTGQLAICVEECRSNSDCGGDEICCPGACSGGICTRGVAMTPACPAVREQYANRSSALYVPQCEADGSYSPIQCHASTGCWCVNTQTGVPTSVATPVSVGNPQCDVCEDDGDRYAVGESFTADDGCNTCVCTASGVLCTLVACAPAPCLVGDIEVRHGNTHEDECSKCTCLFGQLDCIRRVCTVEPEALTAVTEVRMPFDGDFDAIMATDESREEFEREVRRTMLRLYTQAHGLMESQIDNIEFRRGSIIVIVTFTESEDQMQGANVTILVNQMGQDYESGMLIIHYDNGVLQPNGEFSSNVQTQEEGAGLLWWHILLIVVAGVVLAGVVILLAVMLIYRSRKKAQWKLASPVYSPENAYANPWPTTYTNADDDIELKTASDYVEPIKA